MINENKIIRNAAKNEIEIELMAEINQILLSLRIIKRQIRKLRIRELMTAQ